MAETAPTPTIELPRKPDLGAPGWSGTPSGRWGVRPNTYLEHNTALRGAAWARDVEKMKRTSTAVFVGWFAMRGLLQAGTFKAVRPHEKASQELADLVNEAMGWDGQPGRMLTPWAPTFAVILESVLGGWRTLAIEWRYEGGQWWPTLHDREPYTLYRWDDRDGVLHGLWQTPDPEQGGGNPYMAAHEFLLFNWNVTGRNHEGMGLLRPAWGDWKDLIHEKRTLIAASDRYALPPVEVETDQEFLQRNWPTDQSKPGQTWVKWAEGEADKLAEQARNLRANEQGHITRYRGFSLKPLFTGTFDPAPLLSTIRALEHSILRTMLAQHVMLGVTDTGARATSETHEDLRRSTALHISRGVADVLMGPARPGGGLIGQIVHYNKGRATVKATELPVITIDGITQPEWARRIELLPQLLDGWLTPTDDDEDTLRAGLGLRTREASITRTPDQRLALRSAQTTGTPAPDAAAGGAAPGRPGRKSAADILRERREQRRQEREQPPADQTDDEEAEE